MAINSYFKRFYDWLRCPAISCALLGITAALFVIFLQFIGFLQGLERRTFDILLLQRPVVEIDNRIVIIGETEPDIRRWGHPLSDKVLADALQILEDSNVRVIGVDKYRDVSVAPGTKKLKNVLQKYSNIVWIFFTGNSKQEFIPAPAILNNSPEKTGFNDVIEDSDGVTRRGLLFLDVDNTTYYAFPLLLSLHYLAHENIAAASDEKGNFSLNDISLPPIDSNFVAYSDVDTGGYQIMLDYPGLPQYFPFFSLSDLLDKKIPVNALKDKIVLVGGTAPSLSDYRFLPSEMKRFGVEHHAYFVSQLLNTALKHKFPLRTWSNHFQYLWLFFWCLIGALTGIRRVNFFLFLLFIITEFVCLLGTTILLLNQSWWTPLIAPLLGWLLSLGINILYFSSQERAERRQLMQLFASHVSPEIAAKLWETRSQFFSEGGVRPDTLTATVLFSDISNFAAIAEKMPPLMLMRWLNEYMGEMSRLVTVHNGMVNKYIGDAIMAIFGVPVKRETESEMANDAENAVQCAIDFTARLRELNEQWEKQGLPIITMRVGIYTGTLVAGSFGGIVRMEYTVIGDTVNTASRLESFDKTISTPDAQNPCRILIGESTFNYLSPIHQTQMVGQFQLKGKDEYSKIYQVMTKQS